METNKIVVIVGSSLLAVVVILAVTNYFKLFDEQKIKTYN